MKGGADVYPDLVGREVGSQLPPPGVGSCGSPNSSLAFSQKPDPVGSWELGAGHWNVNGEM